MKKILYIYLLLVSSSVCAMKPESKNKKPFLTNQEIAGTILIGAPLAHTCLTTVSYIVAPQLTAGMILLGAAKIGATALGTAMIMNENQPNKNKDK